MERTIPLTLQWDESLDIGADTGTPVEDRDYQIPFRFSGKLHKVTIRLQPRSLTPAEEALLQREGQRNNRASE
jgi:arylsulfatase